MAVRLSKRYFWNSNAFYEYFNHEEVRAIRCFLSTRLGPPNLDLGGGPNSDDYAPGSTVIDISDESLCLYPRGRCLQFDLDAVGRGSRLPFQKGYFATASMVSLWQYLRHPISLLHELSRVIKDNGRLFIVNAQGRGFTHSAVRFGSTKSVVIQREVERAGYRADLSQIPAWPNRVGPVRYEFRCVVVTFP